MKFGINPGEGLRLLCDHPFELSADPLKISSRSERSSQLAREPLDLAERQASLAHSEDERSFRKLFWAVIAILCARICRGGKEDSVFVVEAQRLFTHAAEPREFTYAVHGWLSL